MTEIPNPNVIKQTWLDSGFLVSTIKLTSPEQRAIDSMTSIAAMLVGEEHNATDWDYETMVFRQKNGEVTDWLELVCTRQNSEAAALTDHDNLVKEYEGK